MRDRGAFPTPLFYLWPPGPDADPYLGAAHGLMGELLSINAFSWARPTPPCLALLRAACRA